MEDARCDDDGPEPLRLDALDGPCRLPCEEEVEAFRWGLNRDISLAAELADSKEEASNKEEVWKNGSARRFLF